ncbi:MAG: hypothetical protein A2W93_13605 [Bacteroidetes bacterium GWF2_43_63]|nr:MAG: hypothetical protein A2W94_03800 [Bacteroidetes bacterium GWE2_42_42]OFY55025.1 MAG: hypothetical protein A2W93_13605 [Bacteroidetes bacterium GWF2_43_63]HBG69561.1 hypothetical protein [Bacteroidales bacterium]HCB60700.1 hypothetical protein [Bacteroidales bacterium]HCY23996.1 hypothetical protein [Bacteroidales bacterium]
MKKIIFLSVISVLVFTSCRHSDRRDTEPVQMVTNVKGVGQTFEISFQKGREFSHPVIALWLETSEGDYIQTLYISKSVATGYFQHGDTKSGKWSPGPRRRPATVPYWSHKRNVIESDGLYVPTAATSIADAYTGPTPLNNFVLKSKSDSTLKQSVRVFLEINQAFDFNRSWTTTRFPDDAYYATSGQPSLVYASEAIDLKSPAEKYELKLIGHGHHSGASGELFSDVSGHSTALEIVKEVVVKVK